jgi:hypothetical protein
MALPDVNERLTPERANGDLKYDRALDTTMAITHFFVTITGNNLE